MQEAASLYVMNVIREESNSARTISILFFPLRLLETLQMPDSLLTFPELALRSPETGSIRGFGAFSFSEKEVLRYESKKSLGELSIVDIRTHFLSMSRGNLDGSRAPRRLGLRRNASAPVEECQPDAAIEELKLIFSNRVCK